MRLLTCYVDPKTFAARDGCDYPLGEVSLFMEFTERYPADVDMRLVPWPEPKPQKSNGRVLRGGVGDVPAPLLKPNLVDALMAHLAKTGQPALVLPSYHLSSTELDRLVVFCLTNGHIPFICSEMMLSAKKRATDVYLWREMDRLVAKIRPNKPVCGGNCVKKDRKSALIPA